MLCSWRNCKRDIWFIYVATALLFEVSVGVCFPNSTEEWASTTASTLPEYYLFLQSHHHELLRFAIYMCFHNYIRLIHEHRILRNDLDRLQADNAWPVLIPEFKSFHHHKRMSLNAVNTTNLFPKFGKYITHKSLSSKWWLTKKHIRRIHVQPNIRMWKIK